MEGAFRQVSRTLVAPVRAGWASTERIAWVVCVPRVARRADEREFPGVVVLQRELRSSAVHAHPSHGPAAFRTREIAGDRFLGERNQLVLSRNIFPPAPRAAPHAYEA